MSTRYTVGWNMPGYLPEGDPQTFDDFESAMGYLIASCELSEEYELADDFMAHRNGPGTYCEFGTDGYVYWLTAEGQS